MAVDDEHRTLLNKQLLAAARQDGNVEELLTSEEYRDSDDAFLFDINCRDILSGNTPLHLAVLSGSVENVHHIIEAEGCDVDLQNSAGNTPLHLAVQIQERDIRHAIASALVETAGAEDSIRLTNKAGQTPNALARIYFPTDTEVISLTTLRTPPPRQPPRQVHAFLSKDDVASDGEDEPGSPSE